MPIFVFGFSHKTASISIREKAYFPQDKLGLYLQDIISQKLAEEAVLLSTCNRSELYCFAEQIDLARAWFLAQIGLTASIEQMVYLYQDRRAISHIMEVACGLDSMILGEPQIFGQMKTAFAESCTVGTVSTRFHRLFQQIFTVAKEIRTTTAIGACPVSVASAAVHFAKANLDKWSSIHPAIIGAGDTAGLLLRYLHPFANETIALVNRNVESANALADGFNTEVFSLADLPTVLKQADIVFSVASSPKPLVNVNMVEAILATRKKPLMFIDIAVPRNIDPAVARLTGVTLYCIDDLKKMIDQNRQGREHAARKARERISQKSVELLALMSDTDPVAHTIRAYRQQIETICRLELMKAKNRLAQGYPAHDVLETFAYAYTQKLLHVPSVQLRAAGAKGHTELLRFAKELFAIPDLEIEHL